MWNGVSRPRGIFLSVVSRKIPQLGSVFGGILLSGRRVAEIILEKLKPTK